MRMALASAAFAGAAVLLSAPVHAQEPKPVTGTRSSPKSETGPEAISDRDKVTLDETFRPETPVAVTELLDKWSKKLKTRFVIDPTIAGTALRLSDTEQALTWGLFKKALDFSDVVLEDREVDGQWITFAHQRRNIATRVPPPFRVVAPGQARPSEVITSFVQIKHGAGNDIYATVRGLLTRDVNRIGNILYVRGPEVFILVDFAANVDYYTKVIRALDVKSPTTATRLLKLERARAEDVARTLRAITASPYFDAGPIVAVSPAPPQRAVTADARTNSIVLSDHPEQLDELARIVRELDGETSPLASRNDDPTFAEQLLRSSGDFAALCLLLFAGVRVLSRRKPVEGGDDPAPTRGPASPSPIAGTI